MTTPSVQSALVNKQITYFAHIVLQLGCSTMLPIVKDFRVNVITFWDYFSQNWEKKEFKTGIQITQNWETKKKNSCIFVCPLGL